MTIRSIRRPLAVACVLATTAFATRAGRAQPAAPTTAPAAIPNVAGVTDADPRPTPELDKAANDAFNGGDYAKALPMLKNLALRLRATPDAAGPILEKVRVCETQIAQQQGQPQIEGINAPRKPHPKLDPNAPGPYELTLQKLGNFSYDPEKGGGIPDDVVALTGATVKVSGYMIPVDESDKITKFVLVPDLYGCCFGQPPQIQHTCVVSCPTGKAVSYFPDRISVQGKLKVAEQKDDGFVTSIFEITADSIRPAAQ